MPEHIPVLVSEVLESLKPKPNQNFIDSTVGFGGHAREILKKTFPKGQLLAIDQDPVAIEEAKKQLKNYLGRVQFAQVNFAELGLVIRDWKVGEIAGILFDLGTSTDQLTSEERGFSFRGDAPLDMRMSPKIQITAAQIINRAKFQELKRILKDYGEEPWAAKIAAEIVKVRAQKPITRTAELVEIVSRVIPLRFQTGRIHWATKTFQAFRIATNDELKVLESGLKQALQILSPGGRIVVISFHSLEDRIVKRFFKENNLTLLTRKPITASMEEIRANPRSRSANGPVLLRCTLAITSRSRSGS